jgi:hypothetical protein
MDVFKGLLELLKDSKRWAGAIFIGSAGFLWSPLTKPFGAAPTLDLHWGAVALLFLTGGFFATFVLQGLYVAARAVLMGIAHASLDIGALDEREASFLHGMGENYAYDSFHLDNIKTTYMSRLEALHVCERLKRRGLVEFNMFDPHLVALTQKGRLRAMKIIAAYNATHGK